MNIKFILSIKLYFPKNYSVFNDSTGFAIAAFIVCELIVITATSIGIRKEKNDYLVFAPFDLDDLLGLVVRANKVQITGEIYKTKVERWKRCWPKLKVIPWDES